MWWWLFMDPEDGGRLAAIALVTILVIGGILFGLYQCNPDTFRQTNNIIKPDSTIVVKEKVITYDTILNNDTILIIRKK